MDNLIPSLWQRLPLKMRITKKRKEGLFPSPFFTFQLEIFDSDGILLLHTASAFPNHFHFFIPIYFQNCQFLLHLVNAGVSCQISAIPS